MKTEISIEGLRKRVSASQRDFVIAQNDQVTIPKPWKSLAAVAIGLLLSVPGLAQTQYRFSTIDVTIDEHHATATEPNGNSTLEIAGMFNFEDEMQHGFVLNKGVFTQIDAPGGVNGTSINGINAAGQLAGTYLDDRLVFHAFFEDKGIFTTLDPTNSIRTSGGFINAQGQVVGFYRVALQPQRRLGFIWSKGTFTTFSEPFDGPAFGTRAFGINDIGEVVGDYSDDPDHAHGYLRSSKGDFTPLNVPDAGSTTAQGINNAGTIVGYYNILKLNDPNPHGFVFNHGVFMTVDVPDKDGKAQLTQIFSINAKGEIVGSYFDSEGVQYGFLGVPAR